MKAELHRDFWAMYERDARGPIDQACRSIARAKSDNTMDPADLIAWVDTKVWRMLDESAAPTFHDDPTPEQAIDRIVRNARTLARWAYLAKCRAHWRRHEREQSYLGSMSRTERLAAVSTVGNGLEKREQVQTSLDKLRGTLGNKLAGQVAASWPERSERERVALALGATETEHDELIERASDGTMKENAVQQMRSRARKRLAEILASTSRQAVSLLVVGAVLALGATDAFAGEQSGGRKGSGRSADVQIELHQPIAADGEQSGGRGGSRR